MTEFFKKHKKKSIFVTFLFFLFFGIWWSLKYNLPKTVEYATKIFLGATLKSSSIDFVDNKIIIKDFMLKDKDEVIIDTPEVEIRYIDKLIKNKRVEEIIIKGGTANITRRENGDINIVAAFTGESKPEDDTKPKEEKKEPYEPGISIPIDRITGIGVTTVFRDLGYRLPIEKTAYDTNGYLTFSKTQGIDMNFVGSNGKEVYDFSFNTSKEPYSMRIKLDNIDVQTELVQYGYDGKEVSYEGGELNMDLVIASSGMDGWIKFDGVDVRYVDLDDTIKDVSGGVDFNKEGIFLKAKALVFGDLEDFSLVYKDSELNIDFDLEDVAQKDIEKLSYLKGIALPFKDLNVDDVVFNLNLKEELKITIDTFIKRANMEKMRLDDTKVQLVYDSKGIHLPIIDTNLITLDEKNREKLVEKIGGSLDFKEGAGKLAFDIKNINGKKYMPDVNGDLGFKILDEKVDFNLDSNTIDLQGSYFTKDKKLVLNDNEKYFLEYDIANKRLSDGKGIIDFFLYGLNFSLDYATRDNVFNIDSFALIEEGKKELELDGYVDLNTLEYHIDMRTDKLNIAREIEKENLEVKGDISGYIKGQKDKFEGYVELNNFGAKYIGEIEGFTGRAEFDNRENMFFDYFGEINKIGYKDRTINGIAIALRLKDNLFEIRNFSNQLFSILGKYDLKKETLDFEGKVSNLTLDRFGVSAPDIYLNDIEAKLTGTAKNPIGVVKIKDSNVAFKGEETAHIVGDINYKNKRVYTQNLKINQSLLTANYLLESGKYDAKLNILEENLGRYYGFEDLKYRVIGNLKASGQGKKIDTSLESTVDKVYFNGTKLPNLYIKSRYNTENVGTGKVFIEEIQVSNSSLEELFKISGSFDIDEKYLDVKIPKTNIPLTKLKEYIALEDMRGGLDLAGDVSGEVDKLKYRVALTGNNFGVKEISFDDLNLLVRGDLEKLVLEKFDFGYMQNRYVSKGEYNLKTKDYHYKADANKIEMKFLKPFLEKFGFNKIEGQGSLNLDLNTNKNRGILKINDFNLENQDFFLKLEKFNSTIEVDDNKIKISRFDGNLNEGTISLKGQLELPPLSEIKGNPYFYENIKYNGNLQLNSIKYRYGNYFGFDFGANIGVTGNEIRGTIDIYRGLVEEIPNTSKSIFQKIREFFSKSTSKTVNESESLGKDFKIETILENAPIIDIRIKIDEGIKLDIDSVPFVENIKGNVEGNGVLSGRDGKYIFIGNTEIIGGSLDVNDNTFYLDKALVIFNDTKTYLPKVNPNIMVDARVKVDDDQISLGLNGTLKNLRFSISSRNGSSSGNLNSLISDGEPMGDGNDATTALISSVLGGQLTQVLKPISNLVKNTLNISKFRIKSNILAQDNKNGRNPDDDSTTLRLGATLEAEDNIYKDKLWWVAKATLLEEESTPGNKEKNKSGAFDEYDVSLEYRFDTVKSIGVGVGKLSDERTKKSDRESKGDLNYHIDFKYEKRYDSLMDIFIKK